MPNDAKFPSDQPRTLSVLGSRLDSLLTWVALIFGGATLAFMMGFSVFNVLIMRKALNSPILGAEDMLILSLVFIVAVAIPFGARTGAHIEIEMLDPYLSPAVARASQILVKTMGFVLLVIMAWRLWESGTAAASYGETTQQLLISYEPFYYALAVSVGIYAVVLLIEIVLLFRGHALPKLEIGDDLT